ncbi:MAG TPA: ABC transporter permease [Solirubrobacteraceae bacterium]|nr:ABC transporter permease [Solirubrobacteraceae bacterium]
MAADSSPSPGGRITLATGNWRGLLRWDSALVVALAAVFVLGISISPQFTSSYNLFTTSTNIGDLAIIALPMTLIVITGEIDLSVASILALSAELMGDLWLHHWAMPLIIVLCLAMGVVAGAINGFLVTRVGLPSLAVTIGTLTLYRGLANVVLGPLSVSNFPGSLTSVGINGFLGIPSISWSLAIFALLAIATGVMLKLSPLGRSLYAIGLNQEAAFHAGIRVKRIKLSLFVLSGFICAAVGMLYAFELSSAAENIGIGFELQVVTIVLLGGVSIFGGRGGILGVVLAALIYALLRSALLLTSSFNENDFQVVSGGLLILSVLVPNLAEFGRRGRELMTRRGRGTGGTGASPAAEPTADV